MDASSVEPANPDLAEDLLQRKVSGAQLRGSAIRSIRHAYRSPQAEPAFGEVQTVASCSTCAVVWQPPDVGSVDPAGEYQVLQ